MANSLKPQHVASTLRHLHKQVRALYGAAQVLELRADALSQDFAELAKLICSDLEQPGLSPASEAASSASLPDNTFLLELAAKSGVEKVEFESLANGMTKVSINGGAPFLLPPALAQLLEILCADDGASRDQFVSWKSREQVRAALAERTGAPVSNQAVCAQLTRLRNKLSENGENRFLILSQSKQGIRFALKRRR